MSKFDRKLNQALRRLILEMNRHCTGLLQEELARPGSVLEPRNCPVCRDSKSVDRLSNGFFTYVRCATCHLLYMNPVLTEERVEAGFSDQDPWTRGYWALMKGRIRVQDVSDPIEARKHPVLVELLPYCPGGRLLDVGCSIGNFLAHACHAYEVEGLEINPETARVARDRGFHVHEVRLGDLEGIARYDVITFNQLLYGLRDPMGLIREAVRLLRPGGVLYINTPNADSLAMRWYRGLHAHLLGKVNLNVFGSCALEAIAQRSGLETVSIHTEWLNLYGCDVIVHALARRAFVHRRNSFIPGYELACRLDEVAQMRFVGNRFKTCGDYVVGILRKPAERLN